MVKNKKSCKNCLYWQEHVGNGKGTGHGDCRRFPPNVVNIQSNQNGSGQLDEVYSDSNPWVWVIEFQKEQP